MTKKISVSAAAAGAKALPSVRLATTNLFADAPLMERFGFLIRRLHQIHIALFMQEAEDLDITTIQFTALSVLHQLGEIDQSELAAHVGMDRANVSDVVRRLTDRGYVTVRVNPAHGRKRLLLLTRDGLSFLKIADRCALARTGAYRRGAEPGGSKSVCCAVTTSRAGTERVGPIPASPEIAAPAHSFARSRWSER